MGHKQQQTWCLSSGGSYSQPGGGGSVRPSVLLLLFVGVLLLLSYSNYSQQADIIIHGITSIRGPEGSAARHSSSSSSTDGNSSRLGSSRNSPPASDAGVARQQEQQQQQRLPVPGCEAEQRPSVALLMVVVGYEGPSRHDAYWVAVANRRAYALQHGFPLYLVPQELGSGQHAAWEKFIALQAVFQHSCAEWVWMSDADAFVMTLGLSIHALAANPQAQRNPKQSCDSNTPDVILAGACLAKVNTGSVLWRNSGWTQQYVADAWHSKHIARPVGWWDQAAVLHLMKAPDIARRHCLVYQRALNAYPNTTRCHDGGGVFKEGNLLVHFPGGMKVAIANMSSPWLQAVPLVPTATARDGSPLTHARAQTWTIAAHTNQSASGSPGQRLRVSMPVPAMYGNASSMPTDFVLHVAPQSDGFANWGWPVDAPADAAQRHPQLAAVARAATQLQAKVH